MTDQTRTGAPDPLGLSGRTISHFRVLEPLGAGGMGAVYRAEDLRLHRTVALKFVLPEHTLDETATARFLREARSVAALDHPNICTVHEVGESEEGHLFLAMSYYPGETLTDYLTRNGALPVERALDIASQVARGLARAHGAGIVHRDLKPANLMLTADGTVKILDFGLAKARDQTLTASGVAVGTVAYMAPEQLLGDQVDARTDLWSLGVVLSEMLTGQHPLRSNPPGLVDRQIEPGREGANRPELPAAVTQVVERLVRWDPAERYQSAEELLADLEALRARAGARAPMPERSPRIPHRISRRLVAGGAVAVLTLAASAIALLRWQRSSSARGEGAMVTSAAASPTPALAVLPLKNHGPPAQAYFADGMTDELTTTLAKIEALHIIAHQSVVQFKGSARPMPEIGRLLKVKYVVDGSVLQDGDSVRITANLYDAARSARLWGESFRRERRNVMALQSEVALAIARAIQVALTPQDQARLASTREVDPEAYDLYAKGTQERYEANSTGDFSKSTRYLEQAIAQDSGHAPAYAGLAFNYAFTGDQQRARRFADEAVRLDPKLADGHMVLGMIRQFFEWNWKGAETAFRDVIRLNPDHAEAHHELSMLLMRRRRFDEALQEGLLAWSLAPTSKRFEHGVGEVQLFSERYDEAIATAEKILVTDSSFAAAWALLGMAYTATGRYPDAVKAWRTCVAMAPVGCSWGRAQLGYVHALTGRSADAAKVVDTLEALWRAEQGKTAGAGANLSGLAMDLATVYTGLGEKDKALHWLEVASKSYSFMLYLNIDPTYTSLRTEPRFQRILKEVGLAE